METLITILVLVLLSAISGWLKKRSENQEETWTPPARTPDRTHRPPPRPNAPGGGAPEPRPATRSWEEELRRLLEGEQPLPPRPPTPPPSPAKPQPVPPVLPGPRPVPASPVATTLPRPTPAREIAVVQVGDHRESATARLQAQRLKERATLDLKRAEAALARTVGQAHVARRGLSPEILAARGWFANPQSARQAVIVSVVLGPPVGS